MGEIKSAIAKKEDKEEIIGSMRFIWLGKELLKEQDEMTLENFNYRDNGIIQVAFRFRGGALIF